MQLRRRLSSLPQIGFLHKKHPIRWGLIIGRRKWYFVTKIVLTYCEKKKILVMEKFEAEGRESAKSLRSLEQFVGIVKGQNNFW